MRVSNQEISFIERKVGSERYHIIDYIPFHPQGAGFLKLETFWERTVLSDYAKNIAFVLLNFLYENYPGFSAKKLSDSHMVVTAGEDSECDPALVYEAICNTVSNLEKDQVILFLFEDDDALIQVQPGFATTLFGLNPGMVDFLIPLVTSRGLFLKVYDEGFQEVL